MASRLALVLLFTTLLLFSAISPSLCKPEKSDAVDDDDEDLSFLEESDDSARNKAAHHYPDADHSEEEDGVDEDDLDNFSDFDESESDLYQQPQVDEKDVVVLKERNFSDFIENNRFAMVEFYAPWCGHCQALAPEYAAAATELKSEGVALGKVDATEENELAQEYDVQGFPTVYFFIDGEKRPYTGARTK